MIIPADARDRATLLKQEYGFGIEEWLPLDADADLAAIRKAVCDSL